MANIASMSVTIRADTKPFQNGLKQARTALGRFQADVTSLTAAVGKYTGAIGALGGVFAVFKTQATAIDELAKTSKKLGMASEQLAGLRLAAEESGVAASTMDMALQRMVRRVAEAAQGAGEAKAAIAELGLDAKKLAQMTPDEQLRALADAMQRVGSQGDKVRLAMRLFDSEGVALVNTLKGGRVAMDEATEAAKRLGIGITNDQASGVERFNDALGRAWTAIKGIVQQLIVFLAPALEKVAKVLEGIASIFTRVMGIINQIRDWVPVESDDEVKKRLEKEFAAAGIKFKFKERPNKPTPTDPTLVPEGPTWFDGLRGAAGGFADRFKARLALRAGKVKTQAGFLSKFGGFMANGMMSQANAFEAPNLGESFLGRIGANLAGRLGMRAKRFGMEKMFQATMLGRFASFMARNIRQPQAVQTGPMTGSVGAVDSSSREGFAQRIRAMRDDPLLKIQRDALRELRQINKGVAAMGGMEAANF